LQVVEPRLKKLAVLVTGSGPLIHGDIGLGRMIPIPIMGEGIGRFLTILLAIASSKGGVVLVDEIETGLHYSAMSSVWKAVANAAREYDVQIMATTHNWECIRAAHEAFSSGNKYDLTYHRLDRRTDTIECLTYDREMVEEALAAGVEFR
jgi:AAA15 family ATPase/GTPase